MNRQKNNRTIFCIVALLVIVIPHNTYSQNLRVEDQIVALKNRLEVSESALESREVLIRLARLEELAGDLDSAQKHYQQASFAVPGSKDFPSLLSSAVLLFEIGEFQGAEAQCKAIIETCQIPDLVEGAYVLLSRIYFATEREAKAMQVFGGGTDLSGLSKHSAPTLLWIYQLAQKMQNSALALRAKQLLTSSYGNSVEAAIASGNSGILPSPSLFLGLSVSDATAGKAESIEITSATSQEFESDNLLSVQTGSFSVRENAEYAIQDLLTAGFSATISEKVVNEKQYFRVIIQNINSKDLQDLLTKLKESGFEGFALY